MGAAVPELSFRSAVPADVDAVVALVESAYRGDGSRAGWTTEADLLDGQRTDRDEVRALIEGPRSRLVLAEREGAIVGSVVVRDEPESAYLGMLSVRPSLQTAGVGRALVEEAERIAASELGASVMRMTVIAQREELIAWYERRGYALTGEREPFPYGDPRFGRPRREDLVFLVMRKRLAPR
ncbi:MAG: GNAT family N-acetyltransferase [Myxococcota bacterium]|nr:GNAT family N-acetyltransferase [Myxococcota bacterium]